MITIMNLRNIKPSQPWDFRIDRATPIGNPFPIKEGFDRDAVCEMYSGYFNIKVETDANFRKYIYMLVDVYKKYSQLRLFCWCAPLRCHGETIKNYIMKEDIMEKKCEFLMTSPNGLVHICRADMCENKNRETCPVIIQGKKK